MKTIDHEAVGYTILTALRAAGHTIGHGPFLWDGEGHFMVESGPAIGRVERAAPLQILDPFNDPELLNMMKRTMMDAGCEWCYEEFLATPPDQTTRTVEWGLFLPSGDGRESWITGRISAADVPNANQREARAIVKSFLKFTQRIQQF